MLSRKADRGPNVERSPVGMGVIETGAAVHAPRSDYLRLTVDDWL
jgi:hypothetical protein